MVSSVIDRSFPAVLDYACELGPLLVHHLSAFFDRTALRVSCSILFGLQLTIAYFTLVVDQVIACESEDFTTFWRLLLVNPVFIWNCVSLVLLPYGMSTSALLYLLVAFARTLPALVVSTIMASPSSFLAILVSFFVLAAYLMHDTIITWVVERTLTQQNEIQAEVERCYVRYLERQFFLLDVAYEARQGAIRAEINARIQLEDDARAARALEETRLIEETRLRQEEARAARLLQDIRARQAVLRTSLLAELERLRQEKELTVRLAEEQKSLADACALSWSDETFGELPPRNCPDSPASTTGSDDDSCRTPPDSPALPWSELLPNPPKSLEVMTTPPPKAAKRYRRQPYIFFREGRWQSIQK